MSGWDDIGGGWMVDPDALEAHRLRLQEGQCPDPPRPKFGRAVRHRATGVRGFLFTNGVLVRDVGTGDADFRGPAPAGWD